MDSIRALRRRHLVRQVLEPLPVDDEQVTFLGSPAGLVEKAAEEQPRCAHSESSSRVSTTLMLFVPCAERAFRACARKRETASASFGFTRPLRRTTLAAVGGGSPDGWGGCGCVGR